MGLKEYCRFNTYTYLRFLLYGDAHFIPGVKALSSVEGCYISSVIEILLCIMGCHT